MPEPLCDADATLDYIRCKAMEALEDLSQVRDRLVAQWQVGYEREWITQLETVTRMQMGFLGALQATVWMGEDEEEE